MNTQNMKHIYERGSCVDSGRHDLFFSENPEELAAAQAICGGCSVRLRCLAEALDIGADWGVWGGVIFWEGKTYHRKRARGRPTRAERHLPVEASTEELLAAI